MDTYAQTSSNDVSSEKVFALRLGGTNRFETAVKISQAGYEDGASMEESEGLYAL